MIEFEELQRLAEAATEGPWVATIDSVMPEQERYALFGHGDENAKNNRAYAAAASPDVVVALIIERAQLRKISAGQEQVIKIGHKTAMDQRQAIHRLQAQVSKIEEVERELAQARAATEELALNNKRLAFDLDLLHKKNEALSAKLV
jgi:hypothetical protein